MENVKNRNMGFYSGDDRATSDWAECCLRECPEQN